MVFKYGCKVIPCRPVYFFYLAGSSLKSWYIKALLFMTLSIQNFTSNFCVISLIFYRIFLGSQRLFSLLLDCVRKVLILAIFDREKPLVFPSPTILLRSLCKIMKTTGYCMEFLFWIQKKNHWKFMALTCKLTDSTDVSVNLHNERLGFSLTSYTQLHCIPGGSVGLLILISLFHGFCIYGTIHFM